MSRLIVGCLVTLDGVHGDPRSWASPYFQEEAADRALARLRDADAMLMGRNTYEYFAPAWPRASGPYADRVNGIRKYVFSSTLRSVDWTNSTLVSTDVVTGVTELKRAASGDLVVYGYGRLGQTLLENDLVDVLEVSVHPVVLGRGTPLFRDGRPTPLTLSTAQEQAHGVVSLTYTRGR